MAERLNVQLSVPESSGICLPSEQTRVCYGNINIGGNAKVVVGDNSGTFISGSYSEAVRSRPTYENLHQSLLFNRMSSRVLEVRKPMLKTCEWLFRHQAWEAWNKDEADRENNGFLWIKGNPGCGKSTLMKTALKRKQRESERLGESSVIIHYFFNARAKASLEKSTLGLYRSLTYQILGSYECFRALFMEKFFFKDPNSLEDTWTAEELQDFLQSVITSVQPLDLWIFIDALDEDERQSDAREMITFLADLSEQAQQQGSSCSLHVCLSSRHYPHISIAKGISLVIEEVQEHTCDIDTYVLRKLRSDGGEEMTELRNEICQKANHIFLWAVLVVDLLNEMDDSGALMADMKARLDTIPEQLDSLLNEILTKTTIDNERTALLLQWILFSREPLTPQELYIAIEHSLPLLIPTYHPRSDAHLVPSERLHRFILAHSRGLVQVVTKSVTLFGVTLSVVQLIHETVREFLLNGGLLLLKHDFPTAIEGYSHDMLKECCSRYIASSEIPSGLDSCSEGEYLVIDGKDLIIERSFPFMIYATKNVYYHAEQAQSAGFAQLDFLRSKMGQQDTWCAHERSWWNLIYISGPLYPTATLLCLLAQENLPGLLKCLLAISGDHIDDVDTDHGTALMHACYSCCQDAVRVLLDGGADANLQAGRYGNALQAAAANYHGAKVVKLLLQHGVDVNAKGGPYGNALQAAVYYYDMETIEVLLRHGADVNAQGGEFGNALQAAAFRGSIAITKMLLEHGADVNAESGQYGSALRAAVVESDLPIVHILLEAGAAVSGQEGCYPLESLEKKYDKEHGIIVSLLHQRGARFPKAILEDFEVEIGRARSLSS